MRLGINVGKPTLADLFERIGERTAGDGTAEADARTQTLHHCAVEAVGDGVDAHVLRVRGLHLILLERLHLDDVLGGIGMAVVIARNFLSHFSL